MDDGGRPESGVPALLTLSGPRTDQPMTDSATFTLTAAGGGTLSEVRWWFIQPASNTFDGEPLPFVQEPSSGLMVPRYPDGQRSVITELAECAAQSTCRYQAAHPGALVAMAKMPNGSYLGAGNRGLNRPHVRITVDSTTLAEGDTTVFRTTAPGAKELTVTGYSFVPSAPVTGLAMRGSRALQVPGTASGGPAVSAPSPQRLAVRQGTSTSATEGVTAVRGGRKAHFLDATFDCSDVADTVCYDNPPQTGYEVVTATVDGALQRDSVLVTVIPLITIVIDSAGGPNEGSFLTAQPRNSDRRENVITLKAQVSPASLAANVEWEVVALDTMLVRTVPPDSVRRGASTSFVVPTANQSTSLRRWPGTPHHRLMSDAEKAAQLLRKSLGYRITAKITSNGQTVRSPSVVVRQDEIDTIREEYVEFRVDTVIPREMFGQRGDPGRNTNTDYTIWVTELDLITGMDAMQAAARVNWNRAVTVISGYRNPVHHFKHAVASARNSAHIRGRATDWNIFDPPTETDSLTNRPIRLSSEQYFERPGSSPSPLRCTDVSNPGSISSTIPQPPRRAWSTPIPTGSDRDREGRTSDAH